MNSFFEISSFGSEKLRASANNSNAAFIDSRVSGVGLFGSLGA